MYIVAALLTEVRATFTIPIVASTLALIISCTGTLVIVNVVASNIVLIFVLGSKNPPDPLTSRFIPTTSSAVDGTVTVVGDQGPTKLVPLETIIQSGLGILSPL